MSRQVPIIGLFLAAFSRVCSETWEQTIEHKDLENSHFENQVESLASEEIAAFKQKQRPGKMASLRAQAALPGSIPSVPMEVLNCL